MSILERRVQLLLDQEQYDRLAHEANRSGRSVNAVIRQAIDLHFPSTAEVRVAAIADLLASPDGVAGIPQDYGRFKQDLEAALNEPRW